MLYLDGSGTSDFEGVVSGGSSGIAKDGSGTLILGNANNSFSGQIFVHNGTLQFASIQNVGGGTERPGAPTTAANGTIYLAGTLAYVGNGSTSNRVIDVADGPGAVGATTGVIDASGGGALALTGGVTCENASTTHTAPYGTSTLVLQGSGSGSQSGAHHDSGGTTNVMSLVKTGSGTWNLSGANTYTGTTAVNGGLLTISGTAGSIGQSTALTVSGGTVQLDDSALANNFSSSRLGSQPISLQGGALAASTWAASAAARRRIGAITAAVGENTLALSPAGQRRHQRRFAQPHGRRHAELHRPAERSSNGVVLSGMPSGSNFINAGTFVNGADYAVYDAGGLHAGHGRRPQRMGLRHFRHQFPARALDHGRSPRSPRSTLADVEPQRRQHRLLAGQRPDAHPLERRHPQDRRRHGHDRRRSGHQHRGRICPPHRHRQRPTHHRHAA